MKRIDKLYNPFIVAIISVVISLTVYLLIAIFFNVEDFSIGIILSTIIPIAVSFPVSSIMIKHHKKINAQKIKLAELDSTNKKLFSIISHDVKNPIITLKGMVDVLINNDLSIEEAKEYLNSLSKKTDNVLSFLNELLDWSKRQTQKDSTIINNFNCKEVILQVVNLLDNEKALKNIKLNIENIDQTIFGDKNMYAFLIRNLYSNAIKFTSENGKIEIYTETKKDKHLTIIKDSGRGISKADINKILDKNNWFTKKGTLDELGTGFGINTCINYLNDIDGELLIESKLEKGTKMTIIIPQKKNK